ncbi:MAG: hypothetical protein R3E56_11635 [Burkholderiaceae bacterium]
MCTTLPPFGDQWRAMLHAPQEGGGFVDVARVAGDGWRQVCQPLQQQIRPEKREDRAGSGLRVQPVGEARFHPGGLEHKGQWPAPRGQAGRQALGVAGALHFHPAEGGAFFLASMTPQACR